MQRYLAPAALLLVAALTTPLTARASLDASAIRPSAVVLHAASHHFDCKPVRENNGCRYNERNPGLSIEFAAPRLSGWDTYLRAGGYLDSFSKDAWYAGAGVRQRWRAGSWHWGAALTVGYLDGSGRQGLLVLPTLEAGYKDVTLELGVVPRLGEANTGVLTFGLRVETGQW